MINKETNTPFAPRYRTKQRCVFSGITGTAAASYVLRLYASPLTPLSGGGWPGLHVVASATLDAVGFQNLCSAAGPYYRWVCHGVKMRATVVPQDVSDQCLVVIVPQDTSLSAPTGAADAAAEPYATKMLVNSGSRPQYLQCDWKVKKILGIDDPINIQAIENLSGIYNGLPTWINGAFLCIDKISGANFTAAMSYMVEAEFDVEYFDLVGGALLDLSRRIDVKGGGHESDVRPITPTSKAFVPRRYHCVDGENVPCTDSCIYCNK